MYSNRLSVECICADKGFGKLILTLSFKDISEFTKWAASRSNIAKEDGYKFSFRMI